jgi:hypothetical protein
MQGDAILQPHEVAFTVLFFTSALAQMAYMFARPQHYKARRQAISFINRMLRLAMTVTSAALANPAKMQSSVEAYLAVAPSHLAAHAANSGACAAQHSSIASTAAGGAAAAGPCATATHGLKTPAETRSADLAMVARGVMTEPLLGMLFVNFLVPFRVAVPIQVASFLASVWRHLAPACASIAYIDASAAALLPLCQHANWLIYAAAQLLDWHFPVGPAWMSTASDELCRQPLAVLVLVKVWVRVILWLLVPCALVYCLEHSLKQTFLDRYAASSAGSLSAPEHPGGLSHSIGEQHSTAVQTLHMQPAASGVQQGSSSSRRPATQSTRQLQQAQQQQPEGVRYLEQALQAVQPAPLADLLQPAGLLGSLLRFVLSVGAVLCAVLVSWWVCELGVMAVLHGREFVCDAEGWLRLK